MRAAPQLGEERRRLAAFSGEWAGDEGVDAVRFFEPGPADDFGSARTAPKGFSLMLQRRSQRDGKAILEAHDPIAFDRGGGRHELSWHDSVGFAPESPAVGRSKDDALILKRATSRGSARQRVAFGGPDTYSQVLQFSPDDEGRSDLLTATYRRVAAA